jgi:hypothetical protein
MDNVNVLLANRIEGDIERPLMQRWRTAVRNDERIRSDADLSLKELTDHVPQIIEELCELIRLGKEASVSNINEARASVYMRIHQGYTGPELVVELSLLRRILLNHLADLGSDEQFEMDLRMYAHIGGIINSYLDLELRYAIAVFSDLAGGNITLNES